MRDGNLSRGLWLIVLGSLLMLNTLGIVNWAVWVYLLQWWPVILIAVGVQMLLGRRVFHLVLAVLLVAGTAMYVTGGPPRPWGASWSVGAESQQFRVSQGMPGGVTAGSLDLDYGTGRLNLGSGSGGLLDGELSYYSREPRVSVSQNNGLARVKVKQESERVLFFPGNRSGADWHIRLSEEIPWDLNLDVGATKAYIDLSRLEVRKLDVDAGASDLRIVFGPRSPRMAVDIDAGAANVELAIPFQLGVRIRMDSALSGNNLEKEGFTKQGKEYVTENYLTAPARVEIEFNAGVSNLKVIRAEGFPAYTGNQQQI